MRYNSEDPSALTEYARLALENRLVNRDATESEAFETLLERVTQLLIAARLPRNLNELNIPASEISTCQRSFHPVDSSI